MRMFEMLMPLAQIDQSIMDHVDFDGLVKNVTRSLGVPATVLRGENEVVQLREQRAEQQAAEQEVQQARMAAEAAGDAAPALRAVSDDPALVEGLAQ